MLQQRCNDSLLHASSHSVILFTYLTKRRLRYVAYPGVNCAIVDLRYVGQKGEVKIQNFGLLLTELIGHGAGEDSSLLR